MPPELRERVISVLRSGQERTYAEYEELLEDDIARELARVNLPLSLYTEMYWQIDLNNLFHFLRLRLDWHAQYEIRAYGDVMARIAQAVAPMAYAAFEEHELHGRSFSRSELDILRAAIDPRRLDDALSASGLRATRRDELTRKLGPVGARSTDGAPPAPAPTRRTAPRPNPGPARQSAKGADGALPRRRRRQAQVLLLPRGLRALPETPRPLAACEVVEVGEGRGADAGATQFAEGAALLAKVEGLAVALDERGKAFDTHGLAQRVGALENRGVSQVTILVGGAEGHGRELRSAVAEAWSLSPLTLPTTWRGSSSSSSSTGSRRCGRATRTTAAERAVSAPCPMRSGARRGG